MSDLKLTKEQIEDIKIACREDFGSLCDDPDLIPQLCDMALASLSAPERGRKFDSGDPDTWTKEELLGAMNAIAALTIDLKTHSRYVLPEAIWQTALNGARNA